MVNKKILTGLLAAIMIISSASPVFAAEECKHEWTCSKNVTKEPTCTEPGRGDLYCDDCGALLGKDVELAPIGHYYQFAKLIKKATSTENGILQLTCGRCGAIENKTLTKQQSSCSHEDTNGFNYVSETCTTDGHGDDDICLECGKTIKEGEFFAATGHLWNKDEPEIVAATCTTDGKKIYHCWNCDATEEETIPALGKEHTWDVGKVTKEPTTTSTGVKTFTCKTCGTTKTEEIAKLSETAKPAEKEEVKFVVSGQTYKVTKAKAEVSFVAAKKNAKNIVIPATVTNKGVTYKVTSIAAKTVKANKKVKKVTIGANVKKIAANAIFNCPNLKKVTIKSTMLTKKTVSKKAFKGVSKKMVIKVPKKVKKVYVKIFKGCKVK